MTKYSAIRLQVIEVVVVVVVVVAAIVQTTPLNKLGQSKPNFTWNILRKGNKSCCKWLRSHDEDDRHLVLWNQCTNFNETWNGALATGP